MTCFIDPVIIVAIVHPTEDKVLLGRQKKWPGRMHSCIAGFVEAGESIEEAVRREAYEEAGIRVDRVAYHSSQPWVSVELLYIDSSIVSHMLL